MSDPPKVRPVEQMPNLSKHLGESGMDRIRYHGQQDTTWQKGSTSLRNNYLRPA